MTYYNENDPKAAAWLRELIRAGLIPAGDVDERSICDVSPHDLRGYAHQHFFAGIGGWAYALRLAGWPDTRPVRTGSCPCQPFSAAGKGLGEQDARHLWPVFRDLITFGEATITFGEQVASAAGRVWLARIRADLEGLGYEVGAADLCAAGVGAPQIRQRLYWMARPNRRRLLEHPQQHREKKPDSPDRDPRRGHSDGCGASPRLGDSTGVQLPSRAPDGCAGPACESERNLRSESERSGCVVRLGDADDQGPQGRCVDRHGSGQRTPWAASVGVCGNDGKWRRVEPGSPPLAPRLPGRVALIRGSGNAIVPQLAAEFILACEEAADLTSHGQH